MISSNPPEAGELEITLIGPGFGESIVIHLGSNRWVVIDSCRDSKSGKPAPLSYLEQIGIDSSQSVDLIIASHWHDDHIRGLASIVETCKAAKFCCSSALGKDEFLSLVSRFESHHIIAGSSGVREFHRIHDLILAGRCPQRAVQDRRLLSFDKNSFEHGRPIEIWSLSPSDKQVDRFIHEIRDLIPNERDTKYRVPETKRNDLSVVIWMSIGQEILLLGADLEESGDEDTGWAAIVSSQAKPKGQASVFKIPHHGSITGHNEDVWNTMVDHGDPFGVITPFNRGRNKLPSVADIDRISARTDNVYVTSVPRSRSKKKRDPAVERTIKDTVRKLNPIDAETGYVRLRKNMAEADSEWRIELSKKACDGKQYRARICG